MVPSRPLFTVVVPLYNVELYLPELLDSFEQQKPGKYDVEYVFVNDGSPDGSAQIATKWLEKTKLDGQVIHQENQGVSGARNTGIEAARGKWITFPDSDDIWSTNYLAEATKVIAANKNAVLLSCNVFRYFEANDSLQDDHPLRHKFAHDEGEVNLNFHPTFVQSQAASAFFRTDLINEHGVRFINGLTVAEDAVFVSTYLSSLPEPIMAPVAKAVYHYRKRAAADSAGDGYRYNDDFYYGRFERGYLPLLRSVASEANTANTANTDNTANERGETNLTGRPRVPIWLQNTVLYDLGWFFPRELNIQLKSTHLSDEQKERVLRLLTEVLSFMDASTISTYQVTRLSIEVRALMLTLAGHELPPSGMVRVSKNAPGGFEISYLHQGDLPSERFEANGHVVIPLAAKSRRLDYFGQTLLRERIVRLPAAENLVVFLNDEPQTISLGGYIFGRWSANSGSLELARDKMSSGTPLWKKVIFRRLTAVSDWLRIPIKHPAVTRAVESRRTSRARQRVWDLAGTPRYRKKYGRSWLLMDRIGEANDNGEYLYNYLRRKRKDINAWFVIKKDCPDWQRLADQGVRLIPFGSEEHKIALQLASLVASSHLDVEHVQPFPLNVYRRNSRPWRFVYLQHGVMQHNLSHWFNIKDIDLLTAASVDEYESIVADGSDYKLTKDSVVLTGFPRHDVVHKMSQQHPVENRKLVLLAPTWRNAMFLPKAGFGQARKLRKPFLETDFGSQWMQLLEHDVMRKLSADFDAEIMFLPHPNLRSSISDIKFPDYVTVGSKNLDVQELVSGARVTITDYSSIAFEGAIAQSRIVYFQFDQEEFLHGTHTYSPGYWDYDIHGFGPVALDANSAAEEIFNSFTAADAEQTDKYQSRVSLTFPHIDGHATERVVKAIEDKFY